jgi:hypothetical protein
MGEACGVSWDGTAMGELDESEIPNDGYESHYLNAADTKSDSSFPVVDGDGNLRAGNVNSAWDLRGQGEGVSEECLRKMDEAFDENVLPDSAYENSEFAADPPEYETGDIVEWRAFEDAVGRVVHVPEEQKIVMVDVLQRTDDGWESTGVTNTAGYTDIVHRRENRSPATTGDYMEQSDATVKFNDVDETFGINVEFNALPEEALANGFNKYGVREREDGSLDVRFKAMTPGERKGVEITSEFLRRTAQHEYGQIPLQLDHSKSQMANAGYIKPSDIQFRDGYLAVEARIPNTGSDTRDDIIADFTHEPPMIQDISVGFNPESMEVKRPQSRDDKPTFVDGIIQEFSLTPFPAGYENGGLTPAFSEALESLDPVDDGSSESESQLKIKTHTLERYNHD